MKKLLLLMAIAISGLTASADTAVFYAGSATHPTGTNEYQLSGNVAGNTYDCGNVSLKFIKNNTSGASNVNNNLVRFYKGDEIVITGIEGSEINITKVIVEAGSANYAVMTVTDPQNEKFSTSNTTQTWASENGVSSITLSNTAQARFSYIEVTYTLSTLSVIDPNAKEATFNFSEMGYNNQDEVSKCQSGIVTLDLAAGSNSYPPKYYTTGTGVRLYGGNTLTVSVPNGYYLTEISFTTDSSKGSFNSGTTATAGSFSGLSWTASGQNNTVTITNGGSSGHVRIQTITVKYAEIPSGIADIEAEENGVVEYFNLQGVRVDEPANGLYIRRAGNKVEKVIVR